MNSTADRSRTPGTELPKGIEDQIEHIKWMIQTWYPIDNRVAYAKKIAQDLRSSITDLHPAAAPTVDQDFIAKVLAAYHDDSDMDVFTAQMHDIVDWYERAQARAEDGAEE